MTNETTMPWYQHLTADWRDWPRASYFLMGFTIVFEIFLFATGHATIFSMIGAILGVATVNLITARKWLNGLTGLVSAIFIIVPGIIQSNYSDAFMQFVYIVVLDLPVIFSNSWLKNAEVKHFGKNVKLWLKWILLTIVVAVILASIESITKNPFGSGAWFLHSMRPWIDGPAAAIGIIGAVLSVKRYSDQYYWWTIQGLASMTLWINTAMTGHGSDWALAVSYTIYFLNDIIAFASSEWFHAKKH
ncbi:hypothetical protein EQG49_03955 [Periweissella cryptocerci]|uniref:Nicotinamide mononucleotide transporter n=1 Tax=Periweissella cryptocerci TaxID=2506420 RepID=A0A4P6YSM6_9LACO|nr:nicotinamide riboside transporter PnuC [Periweissella cryptocerci]QBO35671.1 hypothetical protein EQG49_03955 [Periweissella cryptocerci]